MVLFQLLELIEQNRKSKNKNKNNLNIQNMGFHINKVWVPSLPSSNYLLGKSKFRFLLFTIYKRNSRCIETSYTHQNEI